jgi:hypothetical protein
MTQKPDKKPTESGPPLFTFGLDENGKPRGARFNEVREDIITAAINMGCWVVSPGSEEFLPHGMKLPVGRLYASGRAFIPPIKRELFQKLLNTKGNNYDVLRPPEVKTSNPADKDQPAPAGTAAPVACVSPIVSGLPRSWDAIGVGHMILVHQSPEDGWWEAIVLHRDEHDVLTLRFRDYPRQAQFVRHITAVALVNPGPA